VNLSFWKAQRAVVGLSLVSCTSTRKPRQQRTAFALSRPFASGQLQRARHYNNMPLLFTQGSAIWTTLPIIYACRAAVVLRHHQRTMSKFIAMLYIRRPASGTYPGPRKSSSCVTPFHSIFSTIDLVELVGVAKILPAFRHHYWLGPK
jgi:hypothetical protein